MTEQARVVGLYGGPVPGCRTPQPDLVAMMEDMLERVKSGEIQAVGLCTHYADGSTSFRVAGISCGHGILGASLLLTRQIASNIESAP